MLNSQEATTPSTSITAQLARKIGIDWPAFSIAPGANTTVGKIATDEPTTMPRMKWYIAE